MCDDAGLCQGLFPYSVTLPSYPFAKGKNTAVRSAEPVYMYATQIQ